jgi:DNA polymerase-1
MEEAFDRVGALKLSDKERELYEIARHAYFTGAIGKLTDKKLAKAEVLEMGRIVQQKQTEELRESRIREVLASKPDNFHIITDDSELPSFLDRLREEVRRQKTEWTDRFNVLGVESMTAGDFEGTGIDSYIDLSIGFSVWLPLLNEGYYLPYGHVSGFDVPYAFQDGDSQLTRSKVLATITPYLTRPNHGKTFHMGSARYDLHIALNDGYRISGCVWDTLDAMYDMNEHEPSYGLKPLIQKYGKSIGIDGEVFTFEDLFGNRSPAPFNTELVGIYAIKDVLYGWKLFEWQFGIMSERDRLLECYAKIDSKLPETDVFMERCGFVIDTEALRSLETEFTEKVEEARRQVFETYRIDSEFVRKMDGTINGEKIAKWITAQKKRITTRRERIQKQRDIIEECEAQGKTELKKYENATEQLAKYLAEELAEPIAENYPDRIRSFELTNGNHLAYLIYDYLGIEDKTYKVKRGKKRSTAADVLEMYYEDEETLKPLATVAEYEKLLNTYIRPIIGSGDEPSVLEVDGRLHSNFKAGGTSTGRYSSSGYKGRPTDILDEFS